MLRSQFTKSRHSVTAAAGRHITSSATEELKLGDFRPADKGQMELYLRWLAKNDTQPGEKPPIGLILCAGSKRETVELLELEKSGIRVASYWLQLLPRKLLEKKLHDAIVVARALIEARETGK